MTSDNCPKHDFVSDYARGELSDDEAAVVGSHVAECSRCEDTLSSIDASSETLIALLRGPVSSDLEKYLGESAYHDAVHRIRTSLDEDDDLSAESERSLEDPLAGRTTLGSYELIERIGQGGMGVVYKARQVKLDKLVAIKVLRVNNKLSDAVLRFEREMIAVGRLDHPQIVRRWTRRKSMDCIFWSWNMCPDSRSRNSC